MILVVLVVLVAAAVAIAVVVARASVRSSGGMTTPVLVGFDLGRPSPPMTRASDRPTRPRRPTLTETRLRAFDPGESVFTGSESIFARATKEAGMADTATGLPFKRPRRQPEPDAPPAEPMTIASADLPTDLEQRPVVNAPVDDPDALISSLDADDRLRAVELVAQSSDNVIVATIIRALADPAPRVRRRAAIELGRLRLTEAIPALDHAIDDSDGTVRVAAVEALGRMDDDAVVPPLITALKDPLAAVRETATEGLVQRQSPHAVQMLATALESSALRHAALDVLSQMGQAAVDRLVELLAGANGQRPELAAALAEMAGPDLFDVELSMPDPARRRRAVEALGAIGTPPAVASLIQTLVDPEPDVRVRAAELLGELGDPAARDELERAVHDPMPEVGESARRALALLEPHRQTDPALADQ